ncbi:GSCOCG00003358001-RA-CDS [Cotesia congregata]|nr:GSCOCG00003358001-RA-CDS [Cotesia congregata]
MTLLIDTLSSPWIFFRFPCKSSRNIVTFHGEIFSVLSTSRLRY